MWATICARKLIEAKNLNEYEQCRRVLIESIRDMLPDAAKSLQSSILLVNIVSLLKVGQEFGKEKSKSFVKLARRRRRCCWAS